MKYGHIKRFIERQNLGIILDIIINSDSINPTDLIMYWDAYADYFTHE